MAVTCSRLLSYLAQAFLVFSVPRFSFKAREQTASNKKAYPIDPGLVSAVGFSSSPNRGRLLEALVAIACFRRQLRGELNLFAGLLEQRLPRPNTRRAGLTGSDRPVKVPT